MITENKAGVQGNSVKISSSIESLDTDLTKLSAAVDALANNEDETLTTCDALGDIANSKMHKSVTTTKHVVGFQVSIPCFCQVKCFV